MLFNSIEFVIFLPLVFAVYWAIGSEKIKTQNLLILGASYLFYGWWDWRFLSLIVLSTLVDFVIGRSMSSSIKVTNRKILLGISLAVNLGILTVFKYFNFFIDSFVDAFSLLGYSISAPSLQLILPVGISFYTFQTLSYSIDIYRRKIDPCKDIIAFSAYVTFFPQLVAGPIERAENLLPQFKSRRVFKYDDCVAGLRQMLWGLVKKVVIADSCAQYANQIFANPDAYNGIALILGALFFTFQIYGDFSGYSDIAIGTARLFGFKLMDNFRFPYFARDIASFWRRWHISLSTWFRDYLYIPLGGSKGGMLFKVRNTFIIFLVSGFWHGANWTYVVWGGLNALYFLPLLLTSKNRRYLESERSSSLIPSLREVLGIITTFALTVLAWVFFRANSVGEAIHYLVSMFNVSNWGLPNIEMKAYIPMIYIVVFVIFEWFNRNHVHALAHVSNYRAVRWSVYICLSLLVILSSQSNTYQFIYFQF